MNTHTPLKEMLPDWEAVHSTEMKRAEFLHSIGLQDVSTCVMLSLDGGKCLQCGREWKRIEVKNAFTDYVYYQPGCRCYPICKLSKKMKQTDGRVGFVDQGCGRRMYEEWHAGANKQTKKDKNGNAVEYRNVLECNNCKTIVALTEWRPMFDNGG